jgi:hypothetical protein
MASSCETNFSVLEISDQKVGSLCRQHFEANVREFLFQELPLSVQGGAQTPVGHHCCAHGLPENGNIDLG